MILLKFLSISLLVGAVFGGEKYRNTFIALFLVLFIVSLENASELFKVVGVFVSVISYAYLYFLDSITRTKSKTLNTKSTLLILSLSFITSLLFFIAEYKFHISKSANLLTDRGNFLSSELLFRQMLLFFMSASFIILKVRIRSGANDE